MLIFCTCSCDYDARPARVCLFIFGLDGGGGGGGVCVCVCACVCVCVCEEGCMNETSRTHPAGIGSVSPYCPGVAKWADIVVSLPAQWQPRLSWEQESARLCHAKSLKPSSSSFRLRNPQSCATACAAERWQSPSQRTHGPGSSELLRRAAAPQRHSEEKHSTSSSSSSSFFSDFKRKGT